MNSSSSETTDCSIDCRAPLKVVSPSSESDCVEAVRSAAGEAFAIVPVGAGTALGQGNLLTTDRWIALSTCATAGIIDYSPDDMVVTAGAGTSLSHLQEMLAKHNQFLPIDAPWPDRATLGGIVACNANGLWRPAYGTPRDRLLGVRVVLADGSVIRGGGKVVKNVAGYDLCKLFAGSWGTLGLITEVTFKTNPVPPVMECRAYRGSLELALQAGLTVHCARLDPVSMVATTAGGTTVLSVAMHGSRAAVDWQSTAIDEVLVGAGLTRADETPDQSALRQAVASAPDPIKVRVTVRPTDVRGAAAALAAISSLLVCHVQTGVIDACPNLPGEAREDHFTELRRRVATVVAGKGHAVWTSLPGELKSAVDVWGPSRPDHAIMRKLKHALDPRGLFSPGRFAGRI